MKVLPFFLLAFSFLACQEQTQTPEETTKQLIKKIVKETLPRKKVTFEDIKGKFLHKNLKVVNFDPEKYGKIFFELSDTSKNSISEQELADLGLNLTKYKNPKKIYLAYTLQTYRNDYIILLAYKTEVFIMIDTIFLDRENKKAKYCFSMRYGQDMGFRANDFAKFENEKMEIHTLESLADKTTYKKYQLTFLPNFELKADTLDRQFRKSHENELFKEILTKNELRAF